MQRFWLLGLFLILAGCNRSSEVPPLPTLAEPNAISTSLVLTEYAPPAGYETVTFPRIDANVEFLSGWRYEVYFAFNGVYSRTPRTASTSTQATVYYDQVGSARHVVATIDDDLEEARDTIQFEGVRLGPDTFLVRNGSCIQASAEESALLADLSAGDLLGGIQNAVAQPRIARINNQDVWAYSFDSTNLIMPNLQIPADGRILSMTGELWVSPEQNAVIRYLVNMEVENALLLNQSLPVTGNVLLRYELFDIGAIPNISVPFGC